VLYTTGMPKNQPLTPLSALESAMLNRPRFAVPEADDDERPDEPDFDTREEQRGER